MFDNEVLNWFIRQLEYVVKFGFLIFPWLIILCLISSYIVNFMYKHIMRLIYGKTKIIQNNKQMVK